MRFATRFAAFAIPLLSLTGLAAADDTADKLLAMCKVDEPKPETCDCQVKALTDNTDPRVLQVMVAIAEGTKADPNADQQKLLTDALAAAGLTMDEFTTLTNEMATKLDEPMKACKA